MLHAVLLVLLASAAGAAERIVLVTAFGPFAGRGVNGSETVARGLDGRVIGDARIAVRVLPVRWGEPERILPAAVAELRPVAIIGLGEGHPGACAFETVARNLARGADEAGTAAPARLGDAAERERRTTLAIDRASFPVDMLRVSDDAGSYLCNALLWTALAQPVPRAGFVHLPPQGGESADAYRARIEPVILRVVEANLAAVARD